MAVSEGVDGKYLVIADKTALPQRCVLTNLPVDDDEYTSWDLVYQGDRGVLFILFGFLGLIFSSHAAKNRCRFKAGLSRRYRKRYLLMKTVALAAVALSPLIFLAGIFFKQESLVLSGMAAGPLLILFAIGLLVLSASPLTVVRIHENKFWIAGCSQEFLDSLDTAILMTVDPDE